MQSMRRDRKHRAGRTAIRTMIIVQDLEKEVCADQGIRCER
jgi:hypothetical protein